MRRPAALLLLLLAGGALWWWWAPWSTPSGQDDEALLRLQDFDPPTRRYLREGSSFAEDLGDDEAEALFGTTDVEELGHLLLPDDRQELVLKRGRGPASLVTRSEVVTEPGVDAVVVDPTGAGDAFAAGYLAGRISGLPAPGRLRLAHFMGARAVGAVDDVVRPLSEVDFEELVSAGLVLRRER